ncbi:MAG: glucosyl transferase, partial [Nitrososphaerota archaeon]|nr:glucosyl transferase [Nitrososphaerota archaeon]
GVWFDSNNYYVVGDGMYQKNSLRDSTWQMFQHGITTDYVEAIRGNAWNDIVAAGDYGTFLHFNGSTWYNFTQQLNIPNAILSAVAVKGNLAVAVGTLGGGKAIAVVARRQ